MKALLTVSAILETAIGALLALSPGAPIRLLLGAPLDTPVSVSLARAVGASLLSLAVAYFGARNDAGSRAARGLVLAMLFYNVALAALLVIARVGSGLSGVGLWPGVVLHVVLATWCIISLAARPRRAAAASAF